MLIIMQWVTAQLLCHAGMFKNGQDVNDILKQGFIHETKYNFGSISCKWLCYSGRSYGAWQVISISLNPKLPKSIKRSVICSRRSFRNNLAPYFVRKLFVQKMFFYFANSTKSD